MPTKGISKEDLEKAKERAENKAGFLSHMIVYLVVISGLAAINVLQDVDDLWFVWIAVIWGVGILVHGLGVFILGGFIEDFTEDQTKREIKKIEENHQDDKVEKTEGSKEKEKKEETSAKKEEKSEDSE